VGGVGAGGGVTDDGGLKSTLADEDPPQPLMPSADKAAEPFKTFRREMGLQFLRG